MAAGTEICVAERVARRLEVQRDGAGQSWIACLREDALEK